MNDKVASFGIITIILILFVNNLFSQDSLSIDSSRNGAISLYISCGSCDFDYLRKEITFVNFVREPKDAQVYMMQTEQSTGSGGSEYTLFFIGQKEFTGMTDTFYYMSSPDDTWDKTREEMVVLIKAGLIRYVAKTPFVQDLKFDYENDETNPTVESIDKWNSWVFRLSGSGSGSFEKTYKYFSVSSSVSAERITKEFKTEFYLSNNYSESHYLIDSSTYSTYSRNYSFSNLSVISINDHWSAGVSTKINSSLYSNIKFSTSLMPALEYNLYPYEEASRRQCRFRYTIGHKYNSYFDTTLFGKVQENLYLQRFSIGYENLQKWGSIGASISASNYLHDFKKNNLYLYLSTNIRIVKGLSFYSFCYFTISHDQLELPKYDATSEEVLLRIRELESQYDFYAYAGLSYTFGSMYNNVVNPRFGN